MSPTDLCDQAQWLQLSRRLAIALAAQSRQLTASAGTWNVRLAEIVRVPLDAVEEIRRCVELDLPHIPACSAAGAREDAVQYLETLELLLASAVSGLSLVRV